ncbi:transmembrane and coiled-coil domain protein 3-like isoform X2 [Babylonia areolata]|uniref:transmembrane and coiled-coil domain protein 3-like isoform X2 n=1 Tax=Babylonia areolata TaxID=304850 RepID=UPI003FD311BE
MAVDQTTSHVTDRRERRLRGGPPALCTIDERGSSGYQHQQHLRVPGSDGGGGGGGGGGLTPTSACTSPLASPTRTPSPTRKAGTARKSLPDGRLTVPGGHADQVRRKSYDLAADGGKSKRLGLLLNRLALPAAMKKTEAARAAAAVAGGPGGATLSSSSTSTAGGGSSSKAFKKATSKSPSLPRKPDVGGKGEGAGGLVSGGGGGGGAVLIGGGPGGGVGGTMAVGGWTYPSPGTLHPLHPPTSGDESSSVTVSVEDLDTVDGSSGRENGGSETMTTTAHSDEGSQEGQGSDGGDTQKTRAAIEHLKTKIDKTKDLIRKEQNQKESNVNEYLQLAASADKQQNQRIKTVFEKRNQKSAQSINHLQKKLEQYQRRLQEIETHGVTGHKQAKEVLRDVGQGLNTIVSKPKEFAHLIKNRFGSADNITQMKMEETMADTESQQPGRTGGTLPASFKYGSDDENSSVTSGSGYGAMQGSPLSASQNASQSLAVTTQMMEPLYEDLVRIKEGNQRVEDNLTRLVEEFDSFKSLTQRELSVLRSLVEEEKFKVERLEEQINDLTELHQNEMSILKQDMASMEEKIEYRLDERTTDLSDLVDNCQTRILRLEQQQQQQQLLSMEMVENVTFRTILTKLINVILALLAVVLVFVSTAANLLSPFITSRMRIVSTGLLVLLVSLLWTYGGVLLEFFFYLWDSVTGLFPAR